MKSRKYEKSSSSLQFDKIITWLGLMNRVKRTKVRTKLQNYDEQIEVNSKIKK